MNNETNRTEIADLGGGCFWCMEAVFERLPGVLSVTSGFAGGTTPDPTYEQVCTETTGHAEVTEIKFDPEKISYAQLLDVFWQAHDPTTLNRQGADVGTSYRSIILYHNEEQKRIAEESKAEAQNNFKHPIVTEIVPLKKFYPAEDYHQQYFDRNSNAAYCQVVIAPKLEKLEKEKVIQAAPQSAIQNQTKGKDGVKYEARFSKNNPSIGIVVPIGTSKDVTPEDFIRFWLGGGKFSTIEITPTGKVINQVVGIENSKGGIVLMEYAGDVVKPAFKIEDGKFLKIK